MRCPSCAGLRSMSLRHASRAPTLCGECRSGNPVPRSRYHNYWLERFSLDEIRDLAKAIWG